MNNKNDAMPTSMLLGATGACPRAEGTSTMHAPNEYECLRREAAAKARAEQTLPGR